MACQNPTRVSQQGLGSLGRTGKVSRQSCARRRVPVPCFRLPLSESHIVLRRRENSADNTGRDSSILVPGIRAADFLVAHMKVSCYASVTRRQASELLGRDQLMPLPLLSLLQSDTFCCHFFCEGYLMVTESNHTFGDCLVISRTQIGSI